MQSTVSINDHYIRYTDGLLEKKEFEAIVFRAIQDDISRLRWHGWNREDYGDYISWLYPRISRAIDSYRETGASFETYIGAMVRMTAKEYRSRYMRNYISEYAAWTAQIPSMDICENAPEYDVCVAVEKGKPMAVRNPRQLLILVLKCCSYVSVDFLEKISPTLGVEPEVLNNMISRLREQKVKREREIELMRERVNCQLFRCIFYEQTLQTISGDNAAARRMRERLERGRNRLIKMRKRLARMRLEPTNNQIAELLGIAKGTVDSALHTLKLRWNINPNKIILN